MKRGDLIAVAAEMPGPWDYGSRIWWAAVGAFGDAINRYMDTPVDCWRRDELSTAFLDALERDGLVTP